MDKSACLSATFWLYFFGFWLASFHDESVKNQYQIMHKEEMRMKVEPGRGKLSEQ
jgi:uncharacterized membrane protein YccF (DUF307 family)